MARWLKAIDDVLKVKVHHLQTGRIKNSEFIDWVDKQPTIEPKQEWISVKDRLPTWEDGKVLIYTTYGISVAKRTTSNKWMGEHAIPKLITHWMPLPEPPKKNNEEEQA